MKNKNIPNIPNIPKRDINKLLSIRGEIDLRTKSASLTRKKYSRKVKYKNKLKML